MGPEDSLSNPRSGGFRGSGPGMFDLSPDRDSGLVGGPSEEISLQNMGDSTDPLEASGVEEEASGSSLVFKRQ